MFKRWAWGCGLCVVAGLHGAAWADFATDSSWMYQQQDRSFNNSVQRDTATIIENNRNASSGGSGGYSGGYGGNSYVEPDPVKQSIAENIGIIRQKAPTWIGWDLGKRIAHANRNPGQEASYMRQSQQILNDGNSVYTLAYSDHPKSPMYGSGYIRYYANSKNVIFGWNGQWSGINLCLRPNKQGICTS